MKKKTEDFPPFLTLLNHLENGNLATFDLQFRKKLKYLEFFLGTFCVCLVNPIHP